MAQCSKTKGLEFEMGIRAVIEEIGAFAIVANAPVTAAVIAD